MTRQPMLFILGMHRSGTSAVTRMINLLGGDLGSELLHAEAGINDRGFWENAELVERNQALMQKLHSSWYDIADYPPAWWQEESCQQASDWLRHTFRDAPLAVLKDPRLCRLLPLWREAAVEAGRDPRCLLVVRSPAEVRRSLCRRDPFTPFTADLLWLRYLLDAEQHSRGLPRALLHYQQVLEALHPTIERIGRQLGLRWPTPPPVADAALRQEIDPTLRHWRTSENKDNTLESPLSSHLERLYRDLLDHPQRLDESDYWAQYEQLLAPFLGGAAALLDNNRQLLRDRQQLLQVGEELTTTRATVEQRDREIAELTTLYRQATTRIKELEPIGSELAITRATVEQRDREIAELTALYQQATVHIESLERIGEELAFTRATVEQRDHEIAELTALYQQATDHIKELTTLYQQATIRLEDLNALYQQAGQQIIDVNNQLSLLGQEHSYALSTVAKRDVQLAERNAEFARLEQWSRELEEQVRQNWERSEHFERRLYRVTIHPIAGRVIRLLKLIETA